MVLKKIIAAIATIGVLIGVSGCATSPTTAAIVDGQVITEVSVRTAAKAILETSQAASPQASSDGTVTLALQYRVLGIILPQILTEMGIALTDADREAFWEQNFGSPMEDGSPNPEYPLFADPRSREVMAGFIDYYLVYTAIQNGQLDAEILGAALNQYTVTVNPRYGEWDPNYLTFQSDLTGNPAGVLAEQVSFAS